VQHARATGSERGGVAAGADAITGRFDADDLDLAVVEEGMEQADRVAAAAHAGGDRIRQAAVLGQHLLARFAPTMALKSRTMRGYGSGPATVPMM
jgi:hypothetical protein